MGVRVPGLVDVLLAFLLRVLSLGDGGLIPLRRVLVGRRLPALLVL